MISTLILFRSFSFSLIFRVLSSLFYHVPLICFISFLLPIPLSSLVSTSNGNLNFLELEEKREEVERKRKRERKIEASEREKGKVQKRKEVEIKKGKGNGREKGKSEREKRENEMEYKKKEMEDKKGEKGMEKEKEKKKEVEIEEEKMQVLHLGRKVERRKNVSILPTLSPSSCRELLKSPPTAERKGGRGSLCQHFPKLSLITVMVPSRGTECPVLAGGSSQPMDFQQFRATMNRLQYYDSFPGDGDSGNQLHKIVKKQMAVSDYKDVRKNKRSVADFPESDDDEESEHGSHAKKRSAINPVSEPSKAEPRRLRNIWRKTTRDAADALSKGETFEEQPKNKNNQWVGQEVRQKRWPRGRSSTRRSSKREKGKVKRGIPKQPLPYDNTDDPEPANEWLDASKGGIIQKIPSEFRPKKKPRLKIYHLRVKRKLEEVLQNNIIDGHRGMAAAHVASHRRAGEVRGMRMHGVGHHHPRSFVIRINRKEGRNNRDEKIADSDENDEEDEEAEEEEDDDEDAEDEDDVEEEEDFEAKQADAGVASRKDSFKDLLRSAKEAVTNRVRFTETSGLTEFSQKPVSGLKSRKSEAAFTPRNKKVLIDANIKVDSALSDVLWNILKTTGIAIADSGKGSQGSDGELLGGNKDPELLRAYERLTRNDPMFRRHFVGDRTGGA